jgi:hypothetical protein
MQKGGIANLLHDMPSTREAHSINRLNSSYRLYNDFTLINCSEVLLAPGCTVGFKLCTASVPKTVDVWTIACLANSGELRNDTDLFSRPVRV